MFRTRASCGASPWRVSSSGQWPFLAGSPTSSFAASGRISVFRTRNGTHSGTCLCSLPATWCSCWLHIFARATRRRTCALASRAGLRPTLAFRSDSVPGRAFHSFNLTRRRRHSNHSRHTHRMRERVRAIIMKKRKTDLEDGKEEADEKEEEQDATLCCSVINFNLCMRVSKRNR